MPRAFEDVVSSVAGRIASGKVLLSERVRAGRRRQMSVGPYRKAVGPKEYAFCVLPAIPGQNDCTFSKSPHRIAREFVRTVGKDEAKNALAREKRKREG